jgi:hypothetical protein
MNIAPRDRIVRMLATCGVASATMVCSAAKDVPPGSATEYCTELEKLMQPALWDNPFYMEPVLLVSSGDELLLAGSPNYSLTGPGLARDTVFGVIARRDGTDAVDMPIPGPVAGHRALARSPGTWLVAFAGVLPGTEYPRPEQVRSIWMGTLSRDGWQDVREVFVPDEGEAVLANSLRLIEQGENVVLVLVASGPRPGRTIIVVDVTDQGTQSTRIESQTFAYHDAGVLTFGNDRSLVILTTLTHRPAEVPRSTAVMHTRHDGQWSSTTELFAEHGHLMHHPVLVDGPGGGHAGWVSYPDARDFRRGGSAHVMDLSNGSVDLIGTDIELLRAGVTADSAIVWLLVPIMGGSSLPTRLVWQPEGVNRRTVTLTTPLMYPMAFTMVQSSAVIAGGMPSHDRRLPAASSLVRVSETCH